MRVTNIILLSWLSVCQKLANLVKIWRSSDKNKLGHFFGPPCKDSTSQCEQAMSCLKKSNHFYCFE